MEVTRDRARDLDLDLFSSGPRARIGRKHPIATQIQDLAAINQLKAPHPSSSPPSSTRRNHLASATRRGTIHRPPSTAWLPFHSLSLPPRLFETCTRGPLTVRRSPSQAGSSARVGIASGFRTARTGTGTATTLNRPLLNPIDGPTSIELPSIIFPNPTISSDPAQYISVTDARPRPR